MRLLQMSFVGAVMILAVIVIRALLINKLPKKTFLILWGIILARLLFPFSLPSKFSIYSLMAQTASSMDVENNTQVTRLFAIVPMWQKETLAPTSEPIQSISILTIVWMFGVLVCTLFFTVAYLKCRWEFQTSLPVENDFAVKWINNHPLKRHISIRQSNRFSAPLTYGVFCPVILMPKNTKWENTVTLQYVLAHEYVHIRRLDTITKLVLIAVLCIHWFNPLAWAMYVLANRDLELSCDETVVHQFGEHTKSEYARMLINMEETRNSLTPLCNNFSKNAIEERITAIMKTKKITVLSIVFSILIIGSVTSVFATSAIANTANDESMEILSRQNASGINEYSDNNGYTWMSEEEYAQKYPKQETTYWTYDEYKAYLDEHLPKLQSYADAHLKYQDQNGEWVEWTQEKVDQAIQREEQILEDIKNGAKYSTISISENEALAMMQNTSEPASFSYSAIIVDEKGNQINLGDFSTEQERLETIRHYCNEQVRLGNMTQKFADDTINSFQAID